MKNKKYIKIFIAIVILLALGLYMANTSEGWTYIKFNDRLYVANCGGLDDYQINEQVGCVEDKTFNIIKPFRNNQSNGFPKGTELYSSDVPGEIIAKFGDKYYQVADIDTAEYWGNGMKIKIKKNTVKYQ